jgi:tRNA(fMet)-specific endonuclease VapC
MDASLLDTDILSEVLKRKDKRVLAKARQYLAEHQRFAFSSITAYEIIRGLHANQAIRQLGEFLQTVGTSDVFAANMSVLMRAARFWAEAQRSGHAQSDADLIIAATALEHHRVLVTGNTHHFAWIQGLTLDNWREA